MTATRQICLAAVKLVQMPGRKSHPSVAAAGLLVAVCFASCATDTTTFLNYGGRVPPDAICYSVAEQAYERCNAIIYQNKKT